METWGSWTFSKENENLLAKVLDKFASDQCSLETPRKVLLSSLTALSKKEIEISSSSSDDSDIESDFNAVQTNFLKCHIAASDTSIQSIGVEDFSEEKPFNNCTVPDTCDIELSFLSQQPVKVHENVIKLLVELLNAGNCDTEELYSLLKTEQKNRKNVSEIISEIWPEMVTDKARHNLCEAMVKTDVRPQTVCEQIYLPWFKICESNLTGFIESLSKLIIHFPEYACKSFLIELLKDKESILVKHMDWLVEIMKSLDQQYWCILLCEYMNYCNSLGQHQIPVLLHLVKNCQKCLNNNEEERLVGLCRNAVHEHSANRDFGLLLMAVFGVIDMTRFRPEMKIICDRLKGASKFLIMKALKDSK